MFPLCTCIIILACRCPAVCRSKAEEQANDCQSAEMTAKNNKHEVDGMSACRKQCGKMMCLSHRFVLIVLRQSFGFASLVIWSKLQSPCLRTWAFTSFLRQTAVGRQAKMIEQVHHFPTLFSHRASANTRAKATRWWFEVNFNPLAFALA